MLTENQQKLKEELKKKHQNKSKKGNKKSKKNSKNEQSSKKNNQIDICEADCICEEIKEKNKETGNISSKSPFTFSKNPVINSMILGNILDTPAFKKKYKR